MDNGGESLGDAIEHAAGSFDGDNRILECRRRRIIRDAIYLGHLLFHTLIERGHVVGVFDSVKPGGLERQGARGGKWIGILREADSGAKHKGHEDPKKKWRV